jgi:hypothetical protein
METGIVAPTLTTARHWARRSLMSAALIQSRSRGACFPVRRTSSASPVRWRPSKNISFGVETVSSCCLHHPSIVEP